METDVSESATGFTNGTETDDGPLRRVAPSESGQGLPYAPVDWPNPGDVWTWKVGNKIGPSGYYLHRFLIVPQRLQKSPTRKIWLGSKISVVRYLQSEFPRADIEAFFASFTWDIPAETRAMKKEVNFPVAEKTRGSSKRAMPMNGAECTSHISRRTRNSLKKLIHLTDNEKDADICPAQNSLADHLAEMTPEDFDIYLSSLDDILSPSLSTPPNRTSATLRMENFTKAREELSSLLAMDFPSLITCDKLSQVTSLSNKLQSDPKLSCGELCTLNLINEIPLASIRFRDAKRVTAEATKFFSELEANIAHIKELKSEYMMSKDEMALLQAEDASASSTIQEIDEQIALLQARKATLAQAVKRNQKKIAELASNQKRLYDSVPKILDEVKRAVPEKTAWEVKLKEAAKQEAEILAKFAPLQGFSFLC